MKAAKVLKRMEKEYPEYMEMIQGFNKEQIEKQLGIEANRREEVQLAKENDQDLQNAKDEVSELSSPYNDALKVLKLKLAFLHIMKKDM